jgi:hypothetical protein
MQAAWSMLHLSVPAQKTLLKLVLGPDQRFDDKAKRIQPCGSSGTRDLEGSGVLNPPKVLA